MAIRADIGGRGRGSIRQKQLATESTSGPLGEDAPSLPARSRPIAGRCFYTALMPPIDALLTIMARLRDPESGCPWDLEQDFASISPHTIEEAYEVDEAIASGDLESLRDELGDLLFQVVFQARLAQEQGAFDFYGVVEAIVDKLIRRHPHVFADAETPSSVEGQRANWEEIKAAERAEAGRRREGPHDPFVGIPRNLPALARSAKIAGRIERLNVDAVDASAKDSSRKALDDLVGRERAMREMLASSTRAEASSIESEESGSRGRQREIIGQGLSAWVRLARALEIDPEQALRSVDDEAIASIRANERQAARTQVR
jgi:ATP diphosphatase